MSPSGGTVGPTPQEQILAGNAMASFHDYQTRWLPLQDHFASVVSDMGKPDSWQRQEAEGKGNLDVAESFARSDQARTAAELSHGFNVGSTRFKLGVTGSASAEAEAKGLAITSGNEQIEKAYLANLTAIAKTGQGLANASMRAQGQGGEVASRIAVSAAQEKNEVTGEKYQLAGQALGIGGMAGQQYGPGLNMFGPGADASMADLNNPAMIAAGAVP